MEKKRLDGYVNKTFRFRKDYLKQLEDEAASSNTSTNGLILSILEKYLEWDKFANTVRFVSLPPNMLDGILANVSEKQMSDAGSYVAEKSCFKDLSLHLFQAYDTDLFTKLTTLLDRYANNYRVQGDRNPDGGLSISFYHEFGRKWSLFVANLLHNELLRLGVRDHKWEVSENAVVFSFSDGSIKIPTESLPVPKSKNAR